VGEVLSVALVLGGWRAICSRELHRAKGEFVLSATRSEFETLKRKEKREEKREKRKEKVHPKNQIKKINLFFLFKNKQILKFHTKIKHKDFEVAAI